MEPIRTLILEVTVISGENLYVDRNLVTENAYVVVRTESIKCWSTKTAKEGGESLGLGYALWNEKLLVEMTLHAKSITFEVQCNTSKGMVRSIGLARIAISDVLPKEEGCLEVLSYRLRNWEGRRSGVINFSVKVKKEEDEEEEDKRMMVSDGAFKSEVDHHERKLSANNGIVTGIPVWWIQRGIHV